MKLLNENGAMPQEIGMSKEYWARYQKHRKEKQKQTKIIS
jgi:hypothetical protein